MSIESELSAQLSRIFKTYISRTYQAVFEYVSTSADTKNIYYNIDYAGLLVQSSEMGSKWHLDMIYQRDPYKVIENKNVGWIINIESKYNIPGEFIPLEVINGFVQTSGLDITTDHQILFTPLPKHLLGPTCRAMIVGFANMHVALTEPIDVEEQTTTLNTIVLELSVILMRIVTLKLQRYHNVFISNIAHKIRTPLNSILNISPLLDEIITHKKQAEYLSLIIRASMMLANVISDSVDISKLAFHNYKLTREPMAFRDCLTDAMRFVESDAVLKKIKMQTCIEQSVPMFAYLDYKRFKQILIILLSNAIEFGRMDGTGFVSISVTTELISRIPTDHFADSDIPEVLKKYDFAKHKYHCITVVIGDNGKGMSSKDKEVVMNSFWFHVDTFSLFQSEHFDTSGMGLALAQRLCQMLGGTLWISKTALEKGTEISFNVITPEVFYENNVTCNSLRLIKGKNILVVSGEANVRVRFMKLLPNWGAKCHAVATIEEMHELYLDSPSIEVHFLLISESINAPRNANNKRESEILRQHGYEFPIIVVQSGSTVLGELMHRNINGTNGRINIQDSDEDILKTMAAIDSTNKEMKRTPRDESTIVPIDSIEILVVEDDTGNMHVITILFEKIGIKNFIAFRSAYEARNHISNDPCVPRIALIDLRLLGAESGEELSEDIYKIYKDNNLLSYLPYMVGVSAQPMLTDKPPGKMHNFVAKPIQIVMLEAAIDAGIKFVSAQTQGDN